MSQRESPDLPRQEARSSRKTHSDAQGFRETGCNIVDYRVPGISLSTVQQQDEQRQQTVAKLIEKSESHQYKEQFLKDMSQTQKINRFSESSQKLLKDMDQTEIFEFCQNSAKLQCLDCNSSTEIGIIYDSCGRNLKCTSEVLQNFKRTTTILIRSLATSLRRNPVEDQKHAQSERQMVFFKAKDMLRKAK